MLSGIPKALPALVKAQRLGAKAARVGFDWREDADVLAKLDEESAELRVAVSSGDRSAVREEIGDALFTLAMLARRLDVDADEALAAANEKFGARFVRVEARASTPRHSDRGRGSRASGPTVERGESRRAPRARASP